MVTHSPQAIGTHPATDLAPTQSGVISVLVVDDHPAVRLGLRALINDQPDMELAGQARSADEALRVFRPGVDVAIVDYHLGNVRDGLWLTGRLKRLPKAPRVLIYSAFADHALAAQAIIAGADGLLGKHELGQELCRAIRRLANGQHRLPAISSPVAHVMRSRLQPQDQAIFAMLLHGIEPEEIARRLGVTDVELQRKRSLILSTFRPDRPSSAVPPARAALDYQRPKRRRSGWAA